jgi:NAD(P)-dependent dehydrogenase (short-subunit alcohol dehydrogenase family)
MVRTNQGGSGQHAVNGWLPGRTVVVTGASRGIGAATAIAVAGRGAKLVLAARDSQRLNLVREQIHAAGAEAELFAADLEQPDAVNELFEFVDSVGPIDGLVCCAAKFERASVAETDSTVWSSVMDLNLRAVWECGRQAFIRMKSRPADGRILNLSSLSGMYGPEKFPGCAAYNVSKYGVIGLTEALAVEGRGVGVSALCLSPGAVDTDMLRAAHPTMRPLLTPTHMGDLITDLLDGSQFAALSGSNIPLFSNG